MHQLGSMAENLVEERIRTGTASPTEVTAVLRYTSTLEEANLARIKAQTAYLEAQKAKAESETVRQDLFEKAMAAFSRYDGTSRS